MSVVAILSRLLFIFGFYFGPDFFIHSAIKKVFSRNPKKALRIFWMINCILFVIAASILFLNRMAGPDLTRFNLYIFGIFISLLFTKFLTAIILLGEDLYRYPASIIRYFKRKKQPGAGEEKFLISRRAFLSRAALIFSIAPFTGYVYGMVKGRFNYTIHREELFFPDLPAAFDGFTITQLSDIHIGSFDKVSKAELQGMVQMVQDLRSDVFFFTGDIVNSRAEEMNGWMDVFQPLSAPFGKFSILGNHDYGDYVNWKTPQEKENNLDRVKAIHPRLGFQLLLNEHTPIEKNGERLFVIGVENWGKGDFPKFGDIKKASAGIPEDAFRILLSHDPSHWDAVVLKEENPPQLTLSGHTHGFQMGIEVPAFRFSPAQWIYAQWAGLYQQGKHYIYVNRGIGTVGYPGRLGIWPEITQFTLRKK